MIVLDPRNLFLNRFLGTGSLRVPHIPAIFKTFDGPVIHTGKWDASIEYKDKHIALVGSGSR